MSKYKCKNSDKRKDLLECFNKNSTFKTQQVKNDRGNKVELFDDKNGFHLKEQDKIYNLSGIGMNQVKSIIELSLKSKLELREFYYTIRTQPELVRPFTGTKGIYDAVLHGINTTEVLCDINRSIFTVGNFPKGFIFYKFDKDFGNIEKKIGMTENIADSVLTDEQTKNALNVIHIEKIAAATRLTSIGFSSLTNSIIETTGGNVTRAVSKLINRFGNGETRKNIISFTDGDAYGIDMSRVIMYGSKEAPHLNNKYPNLYVAGLYPSVGELLGLPNDENSKRPLNNPIALKRIEFMKRYGLLDDMDYDTWMRNKTYELESLSSFFISKTLKDDSGNLQPIGLGAYLVEYMRLMEIPLKPMPDDKKQLIEDVAISSKSKLLAKISYQLNHNIDLNFISEFNKSIKEEIENKLVEITNKIWEREIQDTYDKWIDNLTFDGICSHIKHQYNLRPHMEHYDIYDIIKANIDINVDAKFNKIREKFEEFKVEVDAIINEDLEEIEYNTLNLELKPLDEISFKDQYDIVQSRLGVSKSIMKNIREALRKRLSRDGGWNDDK